MNEPMNRPMSNDSTPAAGTSAATTKDDAATTATRRRRVQAWFTRRRLLLGAAVLGLLLLGGAGGFALGAATDGADRPDRHSGRHDDRPGDQTRGGGAGQRRCIQRP